MSTGMKVIAVTRSKTRRGDPMWTLQTAGGDRVNVFNNMLERSPWDNSGYRTWFEAMELGQTDRWASTPILVCVAKPGKYLEVFSVQPRAPDAQPDKTPRPGDIWQLYGWHWWNTLYALSIEDTIVFDTETTGVSPELDEAVSLSAQSLQRPRALRLSFTR